VSHLFLLFSPLLIFELLSLYIVMWQNGTIHFRQDNVHHLPLLFLVNHVECHTLCSCTFLRNIVPRMFVTDMLCFVYVMLFSCFGYLFHF